MAGSITVTIEGLPEAQRLFEQFTGRALNNRTRRALRAGVKIFRTAIRAEATSRPDLPRTFRKTRTRSHRNPLGVSVSPQSPLSTIFEHGATSHVIAPSARGLLAGPSGERGRSGDFIARGPVTHPGMEARPLIGPVFDAEQRDAEQAFGDVLFEGLD